MIRILAGAWGTDSAVWVGRSAKLYFDDTVIYAGKVVGGIRIKSLSDIPTKGLNFIQAISKQKREPYPVQWLDTARPAYPAAQFDKALPKMTEMMQDGSMTLQSIISKCQQTGDLSAEQLERLQLAAPIEIDDQDNSGVAE